VQRSFRLDDFRLSAPIVPCHLRLHPYPRGAEEKQKFAYDVSLTFESLLDTCAGGDPEIRLPPLSGGMLTLAEWRGNYERVARCADDMFLAKPYWILDLVDSVNVCAIVLGSEWELPLVDTIARLPRAERAALVEALTHRHGRASTYFSTLMYARDQNGQLVEFDLARSTTRPLSTGGRERREVGTTPLRCWRSTTTPATRTSHHAAARPDELPGYACRAALEIRAAKSQAARGGPKTDGDVTESEPALHQLVRYAESVATAETALDDAEACRKLRATRPALTRLRRALAPEPKRASTPRARERYDPDSSRRLVEEHLLKTRMAYAVSRAHHRLVRAARGRPKLERCLRSWMRGN
jgi:hypothetical protein